MLYDKLYPGRIFYKEDDVLIRTGTGHQFKHLTEKELKQLCASLQELAVDKAHFISFMEHQETLERYLDNLISYAKMSCDVDPKNMQNQENLASSYTLYQQVQKALSSLPLLLIENKTQIEQWLTEDDCRDFRYPMEEVFRTIPHRLSEDQEALLAQAGELIRNPQETFEMWMARRNF